MLKGELASLRAILRTNTVKVPEPNEVQCVCVRARMCVCVSCKVVQPLMLSLVLMSSQSCDFPLTGCVNLDM